MANEVIFDFPTALGTLSTFRIFARDGSTVYLGSGTTMSAVSGVSDATFGASAGSSGVVALTALSTSTPTSTGRYRGTWPAALTTAGDYLIEAYASTPVPGQGVAILECYWDGTRVWPARDLVQSELADGGRVDLILDATATELTLNELSSAVGIGFTGLSGEIQTVDGKVDTINTATAATNTTLGAAGAGLTGIPKTGYKLSSDGLDSISTTGPNGKATNFRQMIVQLYRRFFGKTVKDATTIKTHRDDGTTEATTQTWSSVGDTDTVGEATDA